MLLGLDDLKLISAIKSAIKHNSSKAVGLGGVPACIAAQHTMYCNVHIA